MLVLLYRHMQIHIYIYMQHHNDTIIKQTSEDFYRKYIPLNLFARVRKGYSRFYCERELETEQKLQHFDPYSYGRQRCVFLRLQGCSTRGPGAQPSAGWWLSFMHLISNFSGPQLIRAPRAPSTGFSTTSCLLTRLNSNCLTFCLDRVI